MNPPRLKFACQTFTWEMLGEAWKGGPDDLVAAIAAGGYSGIEITDTMIGSYAGRASAFVRRLDDAGLSLVAFTMGSPGGFTEPAAAASDLEAARRWADFAAHFPGATLTMGSATAMSPGARDDKFAVAGSNYNRAAEIGRAAGVDVAVHPSSHDDTLLLTRADYDQLFALLDPGVGWVPDTGHILRGGQEVAPTIAAHRDRVRYLHLKDVDRNGCWAMLGAGACDIGAAIAAAGQAPHFNGWVVVEEEAESAASDPAGAVRTDRETLARFGFA